MSSPSATAWKLLIIEDNPADARLVRELLNDAGLASAESTHADCLDIAVQLLRQETYSAVLLDLDLPDSRGLETFVKLRAVAADAPVLVLTGFRDEELAMAAVREGAQDYLVKGQVDAPALRRALRYAVERKAADATIRFLTTAERRSEERFRQMVEYSNDIITLLDSNGRIKYSTPSSKASLGYAPGELVDRSSLDLIHVDDQPIADRLLKMVLTMPDHSESAELRLLHKDGSWRDHEVVVTNRLNDPLLQAVVATYHDITERKRVDMALRESEARFRQIADNTKESFFLVELPSGQPLYVSPAWMEIWGRPLVEGLDPYIWLENIHPDDRASVMAGRARVSAGQPTAETFRVRRPDGTMRWVSGKAFPVRDSDGRIFRLVGVADDVTELRQTQAQVIQAQKMEAVGQLAGGVAHDFNNVLTVILSEVDLLQADFALEKPVGDAIEAIKRSGERAAALTQQLMAFSRRQLIEPMVLPINDVVRDTTKMLSRLIGEHVRLTTRLAPDAGFIKADRGQIEQVLANLAVNARDAMPDGGTLTIETRRVVLDEEYVARHGLAAGGSYVVFDVADSGTGMSDEVRARIFEPFFTTKAAGKGTGLGLATCYGIARQSGGHIEVESELGRGTTISVLLPESPDHAPLADANHSEALPPGEEAILVVEDDDDVRQVAVRVLRQLGYLVFAAQDGTEALRLLSALDPPVDLLLTDVVLPGMGGRQLADTIRESRPDMKVLFASGASDDVILQHRLMEHDVGLLPKPFTRESLARGVRAALDR